MPKNPGNEEFWGGNPGKGEFQGGKYGKGEFPYFRGAGMVGAASGPGLTQEDKYWYNI